MAELSTMVVGCLLNELSSEEHAELVRWLHADEANRRAFLAEVDFYRVTRQVLIQEQHALAELSGEDDLHTLPRDVHASLEPAAERSSDQLTKQELKAAASFVIRHALRSRFAVYGGVAAVLVLALTLTAVLLTGPDTSEPITAHPGEPNRYGPAPAPINRVVATLTAERDAVWDRRPGQDLYAGQRFTLTQGFAEVTTTAGAVAVLQAPCTIELTDSDNALRLHSGKLVGSCQTPSSKGFTVYAPDIDVVDLGTEFGVQADPANGSTVLVMEGSVRAQPTERSPLAFEPVVLTEAQARRIKPETGGLEMIAVSEAPVFHREPVHPYVAAVLDAKPALWLRQAADSAGELQGTAAYLPTELPGLGVLELDGHGCLDAGDVLDFDTDQPFSIGAWVRTADRSDSMFVLGRIGNNQERGIHGYDLYLVDHQPRFQLQHGFKDLGGGDALVRVQSGVKLEPARWQHVFVTYDGSALASGVRIYIDGAAVPARVIDDSLGGQSITADTSFRVGIRGYAEPQAAIAPGTSRREFLKYGNPMIGHVGDVVVFDRVVDAEDIHALVSRSRDAYPSVSSGLKRFPGRPSQAQPGGGQDD